jgi:hypothetical protein
VVGASLPRYVIATGYAEPPAQFDQVREPLRPPDRAVHGRGKTGPNISCSSNLLNVPFFWPELMQEIPLSDASSAGPHVRVLMSCGAILRLDPVRLVPHSRTECSAPGTSGLGLRETGCEEIDRYLICGARASGCSSA